MTTAKLSYLQTDGKGPRNVRGMSNEAIINALLDNVIEGAYHNMSEAVDTWKKMGRANASRDSMIDTINEIQWARLVSSIDVSNTKMPVGTIADLGAETGTWLEDTVFVPTTGGKVDFRESIGDRMFEVDKEKLLSELKASRDDVSTLRMSIRTIELNKSSDELEKLLGEELKKIVRGTLKGFDDQLEYIKKKYYERFSAKFLNLVLFTTIDRYKLSRKREVNPSTGRKYSKNGIPGGKRLVTDVSYVDYTDITYLKSLMGTKGSHQENVAFFSKNIYPHLIKNLQAKTSRNSEGSKLDAEGYVTKGKGVTYTFSVDPVVPKATLMDFYEEIGVYFSREDTPANYAAYPVAVDGGTKFNRLRHLFQFVNAMNKGYLHFEQNPRNWGKP